MIRQIKLYGHTMAGKEKAEQFIEKYSVPFPISTFPDYWIINIYVYNKEEEIEMEKNIRHFFKNSREIYLFNRRIDT